MAEPFSAQVGPRNVMGWSIARKLMAAMLLVAVVPLAATVVFSFWWTSSRLEEQAGTAIRQVAATTADLVSQTLVENVQLLESLVGVGALTQAVAEANRGELRPAATAPEGSGEGDNPIGYELLRFESRFPRHGEILVTDQNGRLLAATTGGQEPDLGEEAWWRATVAGDGRVYLGDPQTDPATGRPSVLVGVPIRGDEGQVIGALASSLDIGEVLDILREVRLGESGVVRIYDRGGIAIFDPTGTEESAAPRLGDRPLPAGLERAEILAGSGGGWLLAEDGAGGAAIHGYARTERTGGIAAVRDLAWTVVASQRADKALQPVIVTRRLQVLAAVLAAVVAVVGAVVFTRLLTRQIGHITGLFQEIRRGNYEARAEVVSRDELGQMTEDLNEMLDEILALIQTKEERDAIQKAIVKFLEEVSDVAKGDLTVTAEVSPNITGAIADSFNFMLSELTRIIGRVQETTVQVSQTASGVQSQMEELAKGSQEQSLRIVDTSAAVEEMAASVRQVSEHAGQSSRVAEQSLDNARKGSQAVARTIAGMSAIRRQVEETSSRMKRLGEGSQEIGEIVQLMGEIADRTSILALNASIQAAAGGEAGRGFAVVAEEVERLAERATAATRRIGALIETIAVETAEVVTAMADTTQEVVAGSQLANEAGQALEEIEGVSRHLAELIQSISEASSQQATGSEAVARAMTDISSIIQRTADGTQEAARTMGELVAQVDRLRESVRRFKLPATREMAEAEVAH